MDDAKPKKFSIFRAADAPHLEEAGVMDFVGVTPTIAAGLAPLVEGGEGSITKILFDVPGFSLAYAWFKSGYPLPLHTHDSDCLYVVIGGDLKIGTEKLCRGDGFLVPGGVPYTYKPGDHGVEILEFRTVNRFDIKFMARNAKAWASTLEKMNERKEVWATEQAPVGLSH